MGSVFKFLTGIVVGCLLTVGAMYYHIVRTDETWTVVPKLHPGLAETYVDIRDWSLEDWMSHPDFARSLHENDRHDLVPGLDGKFASVRQLFE